MANKPLDSSGEPDKMLKASAKAVREQQERDHLRLCAEGEGGRAALCMAGYANPDTAYYFAREAAHYANQLLQSVIITPDPPDVPGCAWCVSQPVHPNHAPYCSAECAVCALADDWSDA